MNCWQAREIAAGEASKRNKEGRDKAERAGYAKGYDEGFTAGKVSAKAVEKRKPVCGWSQTEFYHGDSRSRSFIACTDGTVFCLENNHDGWRKFPSIPQPECKQ